MIKKLRVIDAELFLDKCWGIRIQAAVDAMASRPAKAPTVISIMASPAMLMMSPAIASPRGDLKIPMNENRNPKVQRIHDNTGIQHPSIAMSASMKPAVPSPLLRRGWMMIVGGWRKGSGGVWLT